MEMLIGILVILAVAMLLMKKYKRTWYDKVMFYINNLIRDETKPKVKTKKKK